MRKDTLVTGGSDGSVRVWSLEKKQCVHRLGAHDNSVTSLQFDDSRIVSGGSDGRVKVWDLQTGCLVRELSNPAEAVWRVAFEEEKAVILASRSGRTTMEVSFIFSFSCFILIRTGMKLLSLLICTMNKVFSFSPPPDVYGENYRAESPTGSELHALGIYEDASDGDMKSNHGEVDDVNAQFSSLMDQ